MLLKEIFLMKITTPENLRHWILFFISVLFLQNCNPDKKLFKILPSGKTGLTFSNDIAVNDSINGTIFEYVYNGGGVGVGDVNNDGLKDLFFAGNQVSSRLYLNKGDLKFEDVTRQSGTSTSKWCTGVSMVDINNDQLLDIYVCVAGMIKGAERNNIFFINTGIDENGIPQYENMAHEMGLDDAGYSTMGVFLDYDKDQDLDVYILTNAMEMSMRNALRPIRIIGVHMGGGGALYPEAEDLYNQTRALGLKYANLFFIQSAKRDTHIESDFITYALEGEPFNKNIACASDAPYGRQTWNFGGYRAMFQSLLNSKDHTDARVRQNPSIFIKDLQQDFMGRNFSELIIKGYKTNFPKLFTN